jgi:phosphoglycerol transferase MdoB-like AlkP superfamily enzyme
MSFLVSHSSVIYQEFGILTVFQSKFFDIFGIGVISLTDGVRLSIAQTEFKNIQIGLRPLIYFSLYMGIRLLLFFVGKGDSTIISTSFTQITEVILGEAKFYPNQKHIEVIPLMSLCDFKTGTQILLE